MALSAPLLTRKRVIKVLAEDPKGTKVAATQAGLAFDLAINPAARFEERRGTGLYRGQCHAGIVETRAGTCNFRTEMRGNGTNAMDPFISACLTAAGFKNTAESYAMHSTHTNDTCLSIDVWEDGVKKGLAGASANVTFEGEYGGRLFANFEFSGVWQAPIDEALPAYVPGTETPPLMSAGTFTLATESIKISRFSLNMGCQVVPRADVDATGGILYYIITDYDPILSLDPEADLVAGHDFYGAWLAGTEAAVSLVIGTGAGKQITFTIPKFQYREVNEGDREGIQIYDLTGQCNHSTGDDAVTIAVPVA